ncbi:unnamed protein product [Trifolium pratense]|uniref:Uncharacterized protein n=1 Tax=Trifolium pratense TaxID=57577 RepID=A0ACB0LL06_TRIPR|nr:unnamed protein product [Trifolium pratense]
MQLIQSHSSLSTQTTMANSLMNNKIHTKMAILSLILLLYPLVTNSYKPDYNLAINCGSSTTTTALDNRIWVGDQKTTVDDDNSNLFTFIEPKPKSKPNTDIPYTSARVSLSNFTYSFSTITTSPVFIRLHFYPTFYQNFEPSNAKFSVEVNNNLSLLKNFNPLLWIRDEEEIMTKEYCIQINPNENFLNITFIPNKINQSNVYYAFVNGIEVVSMPQFLYYSAPDYHFNHLTLNSNEYLIPSDSALEMVYGVNVGQMQVPTNKDTEDVYRTSRSYGMDSTEDYNVTWNFEVDSTFTYMVRLHFCEFDYHIKNEGDRVFQIFIDDILAERKADVISWSGARLVPVHKDYAVTMYSPKGSSQIVRVNLTIKLQRVPENINTKYRDVILNGIEIFKISDTKNNLAGPNPKFVTKKKTPKSIVLSPPLIVVIIVSGLLLAVVVGITVSWRMRRFHDATEDNLSRTKKERSSSLPPHLCRYFTIAEIRAATNNFDDVFIIGVGGFGNVYKGCIDGSTLVAIKRLKSGSQQGANEFMNEIELLSQLRHIHLVSLVGYCNDDTEMILVYEFMQHGTLCEYLYGSNNQPLPWKQRLEILLGAARGLHYLHAEVKHKIIHRDVKSTNILLDEKWLAKVSDFGLSKVGPTGISTTHVSTMVKGSLGYLDPEYYMFQRLTLKSDVYSFGVVLLEVLCARPPLIRDLDKNTASLVCWFKKCYDEGVPIEQIVDPFIRDSITGECLKCYCKLALSCLHDDGTQRPTMSQVVGDLEFALQLVVSEEGSEFGKAQKEGRYMKGPQFSQFMSDEESDLHFVRSHTYKESTLSAWPSSQEHPFSEIPNPRPRSYSCQNLKVYI